MKANDFDEKFNENDLDIIENLDLKTAKRPNLEQRRVNVDFPSWMVQSLDKESKRLGVTRQSLIKMWLADKLDADHHV